MGCVNVKPCIDWATETREKCHDKRVKDGCKDYAQEWGCLNDCSLSSLSGAWACITGAACALAGWVATGSCKVWNWITNTVCELITVIVKGSCSFFEFVANGACELLKVIVTPFTGATPIKKSFDNRPMGVYPRQYTDSWSVASRLYFNDLAERLKYTDEGKYLQFKLVGDGKVKWDKLGAFTLFKPDEPVLNSPLNLIGLDISVSYLKSRLGRWTEAPDFESIVASSDRLFAKEKGLDNFYIALPSPLYLHKTVTNSLVVLPQSFFQIDPELGQPDENIDDLLFHFTVSGDDENHLATNRFPLIRAIFRLFTSLENFKMIREAFPNMGVQLQPYVWVRFDSRPTKKGTEIPKGFPGYKHIIFQDPDFLGIRGDVTNKNSIDFKLVLDLGVGLSHLHEQYEPIYGGEADVLDGLTPAGGLVDFVDAREGMATYDKLYQFANGPMQDIGGWIDGTCIYYLLVELNYHEENVVVVKDNFYANYKKLSDKRKQELNKGVSELEISNTHFQNGYAILWKDEQASFTERWRALDLIDNEFVSPVKPIINIINEPSFNFDPDKFWNPFKAGMIRSFSRMAVARQVILVNGYDFNNNEHEKHELYSIHFCWPTMDRTWRHRKFPTGVHTKLLTKKNVEVGSEEIDNEQVDSIYPQTIGLREDMTIYVKGTKLINQILVKGRWVQKYLPSDNQEIPAIAEVRKGEKPINGYDHPWQFYSEEAFNNMHQKFSHFGVYEEVNSRCQFYYVNITKSKEIEVGDIEKFTWIDAERQLRIDRNQINFKLLANLVNSILPALGIVVLSGLIIGFILSAGAGLIAALMALGVALGIGIWLVLSRRTHPSLFENIMRYKITLRESLGYIMIFADKRDDKTIKFNRIPKSIILQAEEDSSVRITLSVGERERSERKLEVRERITPPEVKQAELIISKKKDNEIKKIVIRFTSARSPISFGDDIPKFDNWIAINIFKIKIGIFNASGNLVLLFDKKREGNFVKMNDATYEYVWVPESSVIQDIDLPAQISENGQIYNGLSIWFEGVSGLVNCAEHLIIKT